MEAKRVAHKELLRHEYKFAETPENIAAANTIRTCLTSQQDIYVVTHPTPDEDALGSSFGIAKLARSLNPEARTHIVLPDQPFVSFGLLQEQERVHIGPVTETPRNGVLILTDIGDANRVSGITKPFQHLPVLNIDHHPDSPRSIELDVQANLADVNFEAASEAVFWLSQQYGVKPTNGFATSVLLGMFGDTERFSDLNLPPRIDMLRYVLKQQGADENEIILNTVRGMHPEDFMMMSSAMSNLELYEHFALVDISHERYKEIIQQIKRPFDKGVIAQMLRQLADIDFAVVLVEPEPGKVQCSFRSRTDKVDLRKFAEHFGGGGHPVAAAFRTEGSFDEIKQELVDLCNATYPANAGETR
jgi:bifunctional oligoribonuclease and PAP phosphatase NrnA